MSQNNENLLLIKSSDVEATRFSCSELKTNDKSSKGNQVAYINYDHPTAGPNKRLLIQFPSIHISTGGVPRPDKMFKDDRDRSFIRVPVDESIPESKDLIEKLKEIDNVMDSETIRRILFKDKWNKFEYSRLYKNVNNDDDDDEKKVKIPTIKLKLNVKYEDTMIMTKVFQVVIEEGEKKRVELPLFNNIDEFSKIVSWQSTIKPVVLLNNIWCIPINGKKTYGVKMTINRLEVEPSSKGGKNALNSDEFLDDDEVQIAKPKATKPVQVAQVESDDDDSEEEVKVVQSKAVIAKKTTQIESEDDDDDDDDEKPVIKTKPTAKSTRGGKGKSAIA
jgi:hypothetical protein